MSDRPPLELTVEVTGSDGAQYRWGPGSRAGDTPTGLTFSTKQSEGFADASVTIARRVDRDYVDLQLYDGIVISGVDGSIAYEGFVGALPRSMQTTHQVTVQMAGWMAHTRDRKAREIYVDRDLSSWAAGSATARANDVISGYTLNDSQVAPDDTNGTPSLIQQFNLDGKKPICEAWYDAGPQLKIATVYYDYVLTNTTTADISWHLVFDSNDTDATTDQRSSNFATAALSGAGYYSPNAPRRYLVAEFFYDTALSATPDEPRVAAWRNLAVYGTHGIPLIGDTDPRGVPASGVIKHLIGKYAPLLNTNGVQATTYPIPHLSFPDGVDPYDVLLEVNKYHLWQFGVYDNRTLFFAPVDRSDYDWEVRLSDPGVTVDLQGDSSDKLANGIVVTYTDVAAGRTNTLTPDIHPELQDTSPDNPVTLAGRQIWTEVSLSSPSTADAALQIGRAALAEYNQAKAPGTINVQGHIRDRAGHWQPTWKVRSSDRIIVSDHPNDRTRLIVETSYTHDTNTVSISTDSSVKRLDAILDRLGTALTAANLA